MPSPAPLPDFTLYVSCVQDKPVTRLPLPGKSRASPVLIGAERAERGRVVYHEDVIVALTRAEVDAHGRVYERTIREGNLRRRTAQEYEAQRATSRASKASKAGGDS